MASLSIRVDLSPTFAIGPGKVHLLELIDETGSISAAARTMEMSYRRAWLLLDELNRIFREPVATTMLGGRCGGGASLTALGKHLVRAYRKMEKDVHEAAAEYLSMIEDKTAARPRASARPKRLAG